MTVDRRSNWTEDAATENARGDSDVFTFADHADGTLTTSPRRNLLQALAVLVFMAIGAGGGYFTVEDRPDLAALVGAVLGMLAGAFVSGFVIMLLPPVMIQLSRREIQRKYVACRRRWSISLAIALLLFVSLPFVIGKFEHEDSDIAWLLCLGWALATGGAGVYTKGLSHRLKEWPCPQCAKPLGRFRKTCPQCGFPLLPCSEICTPAEFTEGDDDVQ